jgi:hypothetical protein
VTHIANYDQHSPGQGKEHSKYVENLKKAHGKS